MEGVHDPYNSTGPLPSSRWRVYPRTTTNSSARCASPSLYLSKTCMITVVLKPSCSQHPELLFLLQHHLFNPLLKTLCFPARPPRHPCSSCLRVAQFPSELEMEAEVILTRSSNSLARLTSPALTWVDEDARDGDHARVRLLISGLLLVTMQSSIRIYTCRPCIRPSNAWSLHVPPRSVYLQATLNCYHILDSVTEMVATAASATVSNLVEMIGTEAGLSVQAAAMKCNGASPQSTVCQQAANLSPSFSSFR
jgi:hypothetical protein